MRRVILSSKTADSLAGLAPGTFRFSRGPEPWPVGDYKVDFYLNDQLVLRMPYRING